MRKYVFEPLHLNFQSHSNLCSGFSFLFLRIFFDFISSRIHIHTTYHKPRDLIKGENSNLEKEYQSLEISNDFKKPFASFFLSHSNKNSREKKGEHTRLTETVEFGYRAFRRRSLLNKFLPPPPFESQRGRDVSIMKSLVFSGQTTRLTHPFSPLLPFVRGIVFPLLLSLLGYFLLAFPSSSVIPAERSIVKSCPALRDSSFLTSPSISSLLLHLRTDHLILDLVASQTDLRSGCLKNKID